MPGFLVRMLALAVVAAACTSGADDPPGGGVESESARGARTVDATCDDNAPVAVERTPPSPRDDDVPSALEDPRNPRFPDPLVDLDDIRSGGPPPDGIPPIDEPVFVRQCSVDWLTATEPVLALTVGDDARAYPIRIMTWHELVNDTVGGDPVTISYCPLCNSAVAYDRRVDGRLLDFGTSGSLFNSSLVMYDRQTESLWTHFTATAVAGALAGTELTVLPMQTVAFGDFRAAHPDGLVLSRDTGHDRDYGRNPYAGYDDPESSPFLFSGEVDGALRPMTRVLAVDRGDDVVAVVRSALVEQRVLAFEAGGDPVVAFGKPGLASALDTSNLPDGRDVGTVGLFSPVVDGETLTFGAEGEFFVDARTGSVWNILGEALEGPLAGRRLDAVPHLDTFWFAWGAFQPDTRVLLVDGDA